MEDLAAYGGLFVAAFAAATILPAQSELVLAGLLLAGKYNDALLLLVASIGNVLGSLLNWALGRGVEHFRHRSWFPVSAADLDKAQAYYQRWGYWSLLASWVPLIGDPLTVAAGVMREPLVRFLLLVSLAKTGRYLALYLILRQAS
ncbi:MAG: DedA family protein [Proteobacteria bacterium]|nr:DedA family protein [Pseudomonadota bacterium]